MTETALVPKRSYRKKDPEIVYSMNLAFGLTLNAKRSANAWWMEQDRVYRLINGFRLDLNIPQACTYAGITLPQYKYFVKLHPEFNEAKNGYRLEPTVKAQMTIIKALNEGNNFKLAMWWLERKMPQEFGSPSRKTRRQEKIQRAQERTMVHTDPILEAEGRKLAKEYEAKYRELIVQSIKRKAQTSS